MNLHAGMHVTTVTSKACILGQIEDVVIREFRVPLHGLACAWTLGPSTHVMDAFVVITYGEEDIHGKCDISGMLITLPAEAQTPVFLPRFTPPIHRQLHPPST